MTIKYLDSKRISALSSDTNITGLRAYYKFNEASPSNIINQASTVGSTSAIATSDLVVSGATYGVTGILGDALSFDGSNDNALASATTASDWAFLNQTGAEWTIIIWYKRDNFSNTQYILATTNFDVSDTGIFIRNATDRSLSIRFGTDGTDLVTLNTTTLTPNDTNWHMLMVKYSDSAGTVSMSIDDGTVESTSGHNLTNSTNPEDFMHFAENKTGASHFAGDLDEVSIWNRVLTTAEITSLYNSGSGQLVSKPTNVETNSILVEKDTGTRYWYDGSTWALPPSGIVATGGVEEITGGYTYRKFTDTGTFTVTAGAGNLEVLIVGAGGGGGGVKGGGGGSGAVMLSDPFALSQKAYTVTIGNGGGSGAVGQSTVFDTETATGGGYGGAASGSGSGGANGGGGGAGLGGHHNAGAGGTGTAPTFSTLTGTVYAGNNGGSGQTGSSTAPAGGGGGSNTVGITPTGAGALGGTGGAGISITSFPTTLYWGGGGGGGCHGGGTINGGTGGVGSGGGGNDYGVAGTAGLNAGGTGTTGSSTAGAGGVNTGAGGGGAGWNGSGSGGSGGKGYVVVRHLS